MDRFWLKSYPEGVPHTVDPDQYRSLGALFDEALRRHAKRPFTVCMERWMRYSELDEHSTALGCFLQGLGLEPGARVALAAN